MKRNECDEFLVEEGVMTGKCTSIVYGHGSVVVILCRRPEGRGFLAR
jgi:hypothetical protein